jgi:hypothetical protein
MLSDPSSQEQFAADLVGRPWVLGIYPRGWFRISQVKCNEDWDALLGEIRAVAKGAPFNEMGHFNSANYDGIHRLPYILYTISKPKYSCFTTFIRPIALHRQTQLACALARYRLKTGSFPEKLDVMVPEFIATVPLDPIDGAPMRYQRNADGGFDLWSIGPKGIPARLSSGRDQDAANWRLDIPAKP